MPVVDRGLLARPTLEVARDLLGALLVRDTPAGRLSGRIVELEAYIGSDDLASHARFGRTARNAVMFGPPGVAYVYLVYGMYDCLNIVTEPDGRPAALLVRAVEPMDGVDAMREHRIRTALARRKTGRANVDVARDRIRRLPRQRLAAGPGLVTAAFGIDRTDTGRDLCDPGSPLRVEDDPARPGMRGIHATPRIGIAYAAEPWRSHPWRFVIDGHPSVSTTRSPRC